MSDPVIFTMVLYEHVPNRHIENALYWHEDIHEHINALRGKYGLRGFINLTKNVDEFCNRGDIKVIRKVQNMFDSWDDLAKSDMWKTRNKDIEILRERLI